MTIPANSTKTLSQLSDSAGSVADRQDAQPGEQPGHVPEREHHDALQRDGLTVSVGLRAQTLAERRARTIGGPPRVVAALVAVSGVFGASAVYARFGSTGSGTGAATTGTLLTVTVDAFVGGDANTTTLFPGGSSDVIIRVNNPNAFNVTLFSIAGNGGITGVGGIGTCSTTGVTFNPPSSPNLTVTPGSTLFHLGGAASMDATSDTGCQGATFHIPVTIVVHK